MPVVRYLSCIRFIRVVKSGAPFEEHSPMLTDISNIRTWTAVNDGLKLMYRGEVRSVGEGEYQRCKW